MRLPALLTTLALFTSCAGDLAPIDEAQAPQADVFGFGDPSELELARELVRPHLERLTVKHGMDDVQDFREMQAQVDELAMAHVKVQQTYKGLDVFEGQAIVHLHPDGALRKVTDKLHSDIEVDITPLYDADEAADLAMGSDWVDAWQTGAPQSQLMVVRRDDGDHLAYRIQLEAIAGPNPTAPVVFIDAHTGEEINRYENLKHTNTTGSGDTNYYGNVSLEVYEDSGTYYTEDHSRGDGIGTYTYYGTTSSLYYVYDSDTDFADTWQNEAVEAHWGAQHVYDFFQDEFSRDGIDGSGGPGDSTGLDGAPVVSLYVNYDSNYNNAFWYGAMYFGDGDGSYFDPLTTLDITGHEMAHGVTEDEAYFTYQNESGAIDEAYADVFGAMVERHVFGDSSDVWWMGEDCYTPGTSGDALRYMEDPTADGVSYDYYPTRYTGSGDYGGVHLNSGIGNVTFYLMSEGGTHPTSGNSVTAIGADAAMDIWYRALTTYLTSSATFSDLRTAHVDSAEDIYGANSAESCGVQEAWEASGVGSTDASCANSAPVADAGADATGTAGSSVTMDGSGSSDPDGDSLTYRWKMTSAPSGSAIWSSAISDRDAASTSFTPDVAGSYTLSLRVTDPSGEEDTDTVTYTISGGGNNTPTADAGSDSTGSTGSSVQLDGSGSSDPDGDSLTYRWKFISVPSGSSVWSNSLSDRDIAAPTFTPDATGTYTAFLRVTDPSGAEDTDTVSIVVSGGGNSAPTANAGSDSTGTVGSAFTIDASGSSDPDGDSLTYRWKLISVPTGSGLWSNDISNRDIAAPTFTADVEGSYTFYVRVTDPSGESDNDTVTVTVSTSGGNNAPVADAGSNQTVSTGATVQLDASGSSDADGDSLTYRWKLVNKPAASSINSNSISNRDIADPTVTVDAAGKYTFYVTVSDGTASSSDTVRVTAN